LSAAPTAEIAAAALEAQKAADLERADFIVIAVEPGDLARRGTDVRVALGLPPT
jgi:hypothetical protein